VGPGHVSRSLLTCLLSPQRSAWMQQEPVERKLNFLPQKFPSLRTVPAYSRFIQERFERCLDLYLCPRQRKMRVRETARTGPGGV
jgi:ribosome biogenesis protein ERB1